MHKRKEENYVALIFMQNTKSTKQILVNIVTWKIFVQVDIKRIKTENPSIINVCYKHTYSNTKEQTKQQVLPLR